MSEKVKQCCVCKSNDFIPFYTFDYSNFGYKKPLCLKKCKNCGMVLNACRLKQEAVTNLYKENYYVFSDEDEKMYYEKAKRDLKRVLKTGKSHGKLLEIGCARGHLLKLAQQIGYDVKGVEISSHASKIACASGLSVFNGTMEQTSFPKSSFDIIIALDVIEHVLDPLHFLDIVCCYLKKEGVLILETPNVNSLFARVGGKRWIGFNPYHLYLFSPSTLSELCGRVGLRVIKSKTVKANPLCLDFLNSGLRSEIGSCFRKHRFKNSEMEEISISNIQKMKEKENIIAKWLNNYYLGDQIVLYACRS